MPINSAGKYVRAKVCAVESGTIEVVARLSAGCERCARGEGCGGGLFRSSGDTRVKLIRDGADPAPVVGQSIELKLSNRALLLSAAMAYAMPLAGMMLAVSLGAIVGTANDLATMLLASAGLLAGGIAGRVLSRRWQDETRLHWRVLST